MKHVKPGIKKELLEQLKITDGFVDIKPSRVFGSQKKCWVFKSEKVGVTEVTHP